MFDRFIGKKCEATVVFASFTLDGGSCPKTISGVLESFDKDYIVLKTKKGISVISIKALLVLDVVD